ncbi:hypothetical protein [Lentilactobacillus hilgardii]|uniref:hypothetical protein n=1 Tax=Lentilactobacillus hilgardii TaxID=1588 RepID=UPI0021C48D20|nr:hypothetical protein [Lentilactobacillus hilgardii]MCP9334233.1 hypothetical protein [Lentilactobacillus hilgardii]MCP9350830.1 hypothetical protein [Lentilactobacillus hilgardii]MCP9353726.1 hypothetical protein [Lentilactobacillus hilgardii]
MIAFGLDSTGDLDFNPNTGAFNMVEDDDEIAQKLSLLLNINIAELLWNEDIGLNHNELLANADDQGVIQSNLSDYLQEQWPDTFDSVEITNFEANQQQRITSLEATVTLTTGETVTGSVSVDDQGDENNAANS